MSCLDNIFYVIVDKNKLSTINPKKYDLIDLKKLVSDHIFLFLTLSPLVKMLKTRKYINSLAVIQIKKENDSYFFLSALNMKIISLMLK